MARTKSKRAGKVLGSGAYGCTFKPPLRCKKNETRKQSKNKKKKKYISKLMLVNDATDEHMLHYLVKNQLKVIKNYEKYFLFGDITCDVANLSSTEISNMMVGCDDMITQEYDKNGLKNMMIILMPYGGRDLEHHIQRIRYMSLPQKKQCVNEVCNHMANLIEHAILPMNKLRVYHSDIKSANIVWDGKSSPKLIDWGLCKQSNDDTAYTYKGIHFNYPYETLLFNFRSGLAREEFDVNIERLLTEYSDKIIGGYVRTHIMLCSGVQTNNDVIRVLRKYLLSVANACTDSGGQFSKKKLLRMFKKKQDIWGAMTVVIDLLWIIGMDSELQVETNNMIAIWEHIYDHPNININKLIGILKN